MRISSKNPLLLRGRAVGSSAIGLMMTLSSFLIVSSTVAVFAPDCGTTGNPPCQISTYEDLEEVALHELDGDYVLTNDIQAPTGGARRSFVPIGTDSARFTGSLDGQGHVIRDLYINSHDGSLGLFGVVDGGEIKNVVLESPDVTTASSGGFTASLAGVVAEGGHVFCCHVHNGEVRSSDQFNVGSAAGLVGILAGDTSSIEQCSVENVIVNTNFRGAGLVATVQFGATVRESYATGVVKSLFGGGLAEGNSGEISNSYAVVNLDDTNAGSIGGLVGANHGKVNNSFAIGTIDSEATNVGGLVGLLGSSGSIDNSYCTMDPAVGDNFGSSTPDITIINDNDEAYFHGDTGTGTNHQALLCDFDNIWEVQANGNPTLRCITQDQDFDRVLDTDDVCPDTMTGAEVNEHGCSDEQWNIDLDGMFVYNIETQGSELDLTVSSGIDESYLGLDWDCDGVQDEVLQVPATVGVFDICGIAVLGDDVHTTEPHFIVVYDPTVPHVTGGGWINSPSGAYEADSTLTGKVNFGFSAKYKKGAQEPEGKTNFHFNSAGFQFQSISYDWLVVNGHDKAKFKGEGIASVGQVDLPCPGGCKFMLTVQDNDNNDMNVPDKFRIKIWGDDGLIYDNQKGEGDDSYAGTDVHGNIKIHKKKKKRRLRI